MTHTELWLTYVLASRVISGKSSTAQLIELDYQNQKLVDLEDVLEHVFRQGYVEAKHRPSSWWQRGDGQKVKGSHVVEELLEQGIGKCQQTALRLIVEDIPPAIWFTYVHLHNPSAPAVTQRIKFEPHIRLEKLAHLTNHIFGQGYLHAKLRPVVHWQGICGRRIEEGVTVEELLSWGEGVCEEKALRLVIDEPHHTHNACHPSSGHCTPQTPRPRSPCTPYSPHTPSTPSTLHGTPITIHAIHTPCYY